MGFFGLYGEAEVKINEIEKYIQIDPYDQQDQYDEDSQSYKHEEDDIIAMERYLKKKRYLSIRIGKLKLSRKYMKRPEPVKKRKKRQKKENSKTLF